MENDAMIEVTVEPDFAEYRRILTERAKKTLRDNRIALIFEMSAIIFIIVVTFLIVGFAHSGMRIALLISIAAFGVNLLIYGLLKLNIRSQARRMAGFGTPIVYTLGPNGLKSSSKRVTWESPWGRFTKITETESDLLFFMEYDDFVAIPKRFVLDQTVLAQLRRLISSNAPGTVELLS